jgi:Ca2+-binding EF-hand superfamily protein
MSPLIKLSLAVLLSIAGTGAAFAQDAELLGQADRNRDGAISVDEAQAALKLQFASMDKNRDGVVSEAEFLDARLSQISQFDTNGDGRITRDELRARIAARVRR